MYGAKGDFIQDDGPAATAAVEAAYALYVATGVMQWVYLPAGTYRLATLAADGYTLLKCRPGVSVFGPGVLKAANGVRTLATGIGILYNHTDPISNVVYTGFTVDFNGQNNLNLEATGGHTFTANVNRMGAGNGATNIVVDTVTFKNASGHHFLYFDGGGSKVRIRNNTFTDVAEAMPGSGDSDHSSIYLNAHDSEVVGNTFHTSVPSVKATAIETHGSKLRIHDNYVFNYNTARNFGAQVGDTTDVNDHDNEYRNVLLGHVLWTSAAYVMSRVKIHDNIVGLREAGTGAGAPPPGRGIYAPPSTMASSANGAHLTIEDNEFFCETLVQLTVLTAGLELFRWDDVVVKGNYFHDIMAEAMGFDSEATPRTMSRIDILNNRIKDVGLTSTVANKRGIVFISIANALQTISTVNIRGNSFYASAAPAAGTPARFGIEFNIGWFPDVRIEGGNSWIGFTVAPVTKGVTDAANLFYVDGEGPYEPFNLIRASNGSRWMNTLAKKESKHVHPASDGNSDGWRVVNNDRISANNGDNAKVLVDTDEQYQLWDSPLTANRAVTLPAASQANNGRKFTIRRSTNATGAFNLNIGGGAAVLAAAGQSATFISNGAAYFLVQ
jgi:hypothetical protein